MRRGLPFLLDFMETARIARFQPRHSFTRELEVRQGQQAMQQPADGEWRGGYTSLDGGALSYEYTVPPRLCEESGTLPLPILLALCDEVTSWASISADATLRPGVSVVLSVELLRAAPIVATERLRFESKVRKMGKTLSFLDVAVSTEAGEPVAAGRHLKFVDMGLAWNLAFGPRLYPLTRTLARVTARDATATEPKLCPDLASLVDYTRVGADAGGGTRAGRFECDRRHLNDVGGVHGGYQVRTEVEPSAPVYRLQHVSGHAVRAPGAHARCPRRRLRRGALARPRHATPRHGGHVHGDWEAWNRRGARDAAACRTGVVRSDTDIAIGATRHWGRIKRGTA